MKITIMNCSVMTGSQDMIFLRRKINLADAKRLISNHEWQSAVGHSSTAEIISNLLGIDCPVNRFQYCQAPGEVALVFQLNGRPPEGKILTADEIETIGYTWYSVQVCGLYV